MFVNSAKVGKIRYITNRKEVIKAFELADEDKKIIMEDKNRIVIVCELSKEQARKLKEIVG